MQYFIRILLFSFLALASTFALSQNLILNPGFEIWDDIITETNPPESDGLNLGAVPSPWKQRLSCDMKVDAPGVVSIQDVTGDTRSGFGCVGFAATTSSIPIHYRECPIARTMNLTQGQEYLLTFYVERDFLDITNSAPLYIGAYFTQNDLSCDSDGAGGAQICPLLELTPQVEGTIAYDEGNYTIITGNWTAPQSGEYNIVFGNFRASEVQGLQDHYMNLDDTSLEACNSNEVSTPIINMDLLFCPIGEIIADASASLNVEMHRWSLELQDGTVLREFTQWETGNPGSLDLSTIYPFFEPNNCYRLILQTFAGCKTSETSHEFCIDAPEFDLEPLVFPICEGTEITLIADEHSDWEYSWGTPENPSLYGGGIGQSSINIIANIDILQYRVNIQTPQGCGTFELSYEIIVHPNDNEPPFTTGINGSGEFTAYVQAGGQLCFDIPTFDNPEEGTELISNSTLPSNSTVLEDQAFQESGTFCWPTTESDIGFHSFEVLIEDQNVCYSEQSPYTFDIKVGCAYCPLDVYFENREPLPEGLPLPPHTAASRRIVAGEDVDDSQINGPVIVGDAEVVFEATEVITIEPGFESGPGFTALINPASCTEDCGVCCDSWNGFNINIPNVFTPNGDGVNDYWQPWDYSNPFCAFGADQYELTMFNQWGGVVYTSEYANGSSGCCPFESYAPENPIDHGSIYWDGRHGGNGQFVSNGVYFYVLTIKGCGNEESFSVSTAIFGSLKSMEQEELTESMNTKDDTMYTTENHIILFNEELENSILPIVYPNPSSEWIYISALDANSIVELYSYSGELIMTKNVNNSVTKIDVSTLSKGYYILKFRSNNTIISEKIVKL